jgi:pantothenate kinase
MRVFTAKFLSTPPSARYMIAISGIPGSGKTNLATKMSHRINAIYAAQHPGKPPVAACVSMDGYHLSRAELAAMPDPAHAFARRGAAFTFDPDKFITLVRALREPLHADSPILYAPSFDHAVKDPVENDVPIPATARVIFFEGNYLSLNKEPWTQAAGLMDELWFVEVDFETARRRLVKRHVKAGIATDEEEADQRARENDLVNGREIVDYRLPVAEVVVSREDEGWKEE